MRRLSFLIVFLVLSGCALLRTQNDLRQIGTKGMLGIAPLPEKDGVRVHSLDPRSPAGKAGFQINDLIVSFEGSGIQSKEDRIKMWQQIYLSPGQQMSFGIIRRGSPKSINVVLGSTPLYAELQVFDKINRLLVEDERPIAVATIVEKVINTLPLDPAETHSARQQWSDSARTSLLNETENLLLTKYGQSINFKVVDRSVLEKVFEEQKFQISGAADSATARRLGQLTGATHLLLFDFSRLPETNTSYVDVRNMRLIDVETGAVVASSSYRESRHP
jgi:membrane-associated protease RseP (regulator of RpoE activity)